MAYALNTSSLPKRLWIVSFMSQSISTGYIAPGQPPESRSKKLPGTRQGPDFVEGSNHAKHHINVCSGGDLCSPFLTIPMLRNNNATDDGNVDFRYF